MNRNLLGTLALLVLLVAVVAIIRQTRRSYLPPVITHDWYCDLNTHTLFSTATGQTPPIAAPSGAAADGLEAGVRAHVFTCSKCTESERSIGWLETYTPEMKQRLLELRQPASKERPRPGPQLTMAEIMLETDLRTGMTSLIKRPDDPNWVPIKSPEGQQIIQEARRRCGPDKVARPCSPKK